MYQKKGATLLPLLDEKLKIEHCYHFRGRRRKKLVQRVTRLNMRGLLNMISIDDESFINEYKAPAQM
jgi:hypothetical protein